MYQLNASNECGKKSITIIGIIAATWGVIGLLLLLGFAALRLGHHMIEALQMPLHWKHWVVFFSFLVFMLYSEGYKGFQQNFAPRFAARSRYLLSNATPLQLLLAPLFCIGYFHASKKRMIITCTLTATIIALVLLFRLVPQPWRGLLDTGIIAGLGWGMVTSSVFCLKACTAKKCHWDAEIFIT